MKRLLPVSEELLNAFVDDELDIDEREDILVLEATNTEAAKEICELRRLKNLVNAASLTEAEVGYFSSASFNRNPRHNTFGYKISYVAASLVLALTFIIFSGPNENNFDITFSPESTYQSKESLLAAANKNINLRLVLHLKSAEEKQTTKLLHVLESVLQTSDNLQVEVVASGPGIQMLQKTSSAYSHKITAIGNKYNNVSFIACSKTFHQLQKKSAKKIEIIKRAMLVASGPKWAKQRQKNGWAYILLSDQV